MDHRGRRGPHRQRCHQGQSEKSLDIRQRVEGHAVDLIRCMREVEAGCDLKGQSPGHRQGGDMGQTPHAAVLGRGSRWSHGCFNGREDVQVPKCSN